jgi:elongation factor P
MTILEYHHINMGRGSAQVRIKFRDARSGSITEQSFQAGTRWPRARVERREMQYLYADGAFYHFMNTESYEQVGIRGEDLGDAVRYLVPNVRVLVEFFEHRPVGIELPVTVDLKVVETTPGMKGATASNSGKPATLETGLQVTVPQFINIGDVVRVDTAEGTYLERAK